MWPNLPPGMGNPWAHMIAQQAQAQAFAQAHAMQAQQQQIGHVPPPMQAPPGPPTQPQPPVMPRPDLPPEKLMEKGNAVFLLHAINSFC